MPIPTVLFYEEFIDKTLSKSLQRISQLLSLTLTIPLYDIVNSRSLIALAKDYDIPLELIHNEIMGVIPFLITEYTCSQILKPMGINRGFWEYSAREKGLLQSAYDLIAFCDRSRISQGTDSYLERCVNAIKRALSDFVLENKSADPCALSNLFHAFINKTADVDGWAFSEDVHQQLGIPSAQTKLGSCPK